MRPPPKRQLDCSLQMPGSQGLDVACPGQCLHFPLCLTPSPEGCSLLSSTAPTSAGQRQGQVGLLCARCTLGTAFEVSLNR